MKFVINTPENDAWRADANVHDFNVHSFFFITVETQVEFIKATNKSNIRNEKCLGIRKVCE